MELILNYPAPEPVGLYDAIVAAGHQVWTHDGQRYADDAVAVQAIIAGHDPLINLRAEQHAAVASLRLAKQQSGTSYLFPDGITGGIQLRDQQDIANVNGRVTAALILQAQGITDPILGFRDEHNVTHQMTPAQIIAMGMAVSQYIDATYAAKWQHDEAIETWDGTAPYDLERFWPGL